MADFRAYCYLFHSTWQGRGELSFSFIVVVVGGKGKEVTFVGSAVGVRWYEYEGFVSGDILWQAREKPCAVTRRGDPDDPPS